MAVARIYSGKMSSGSQVFVKGENGSQSRKNNKTFLTFEGIARKEVS